MTKLILSSSFKRAFKAIIKRRPDLKSKIESKLRLLADDPYNPILRTHKLKGKLSGAWACSVEYDCRGVECDRVWVRLKCDRLSLGLRAIGFWGAIGVLGWGGVWICNY